MHASLHQCYLISGTLWYVVWVQDMVPSWVHGAVGVGLAGMLILVVDVRFIISAIQVCIYYSAVESLIYLYVDAYKYIIICVCMYVSLCMFKSR